MNKLKSLAPWLVAVVFGVLLVGSVVRASGGFSWANVEELVAQKIFGQLPPEEGMIGANGSRFRNGISADSTSPIDGEIRGTTLTVTGASALSGALNTKESVETISAANVITALESNKTFYITTGTINTLPATSTAAGTVYRFYIAAALTTDVTIVTEGSGNEINGTLIVAGAVVDCDAEDTITFVSDGENVGDYVELRSNGTGWFIGSSGALTAGKMTCTAT